VRLRVWGIASAQVGNEPILMTCPRPAVGLLYRGAGPVHWYRRLTPQPTMDSRRLRVFVSHSSHAPDALDQLEVLVKGLRAGRGGVEVLFDKERITEGARWREVIHAMLAECDAAIILVTPDALHSPWVLKEATILRWRYDRDPKFPLFPVTPANVDMTELKKNRLWDPIDLPAIQFVASDSAAEIAASIKNRLAPLATQVRPAPLDLLADEITGLLAKASPLHLLSALDSLNERIPFGVSDQHRCLAYAIARWILRQSPPALERMATTLALLGKTFPADDACKILDLVAPMWVELDAASWFVRADWRHPGFRDVAIACKRPSQTLQQYVDRAHMPSLPPPFLLLNGVTGGAHSDDVARELRDALRPRLRRQMDDSGIDEFLGQTKARFYVALPLPDDRQVVATLQSRYPHVTFVFFVRPEVCFSDGTPPIAAGVAWVAPSLDPHLEEDVFRDYDDALAVFLA
jgi:hypothetical protein